MRSSVSRSFLYGRYAIGTPGGNALVASKGRVQSTLKQAGGFYGAELALVMTSGPYECWTEVAWAPLGKQQSGGESS